MDIGYTLVAIASFLAGILVGGRLTLDFAFKRQLSTRLIMVSGVVVAILGGLLPQIPLFDFLSQLIEAFAGGSVIGIGAGLVLYGWFVHTGKAAPINALMMSQFALMSEKDRNKFIADVQSPKLPPNDDHSHPKFLP